MHPSNGPFPSIHSFIPPANISLGFGFHICCLLYSFCCRFFEPLNYLLAKDMVVGGAIVSFVGTTALFLIFLLISHESFCHGRVYRVKSNINKWSSTAKICKAHSNPSLHVLMDRVCHLCHEMFSYAMPNLRAECSEKCYKNSKFRNCLNIFSVLPPSEHPAGKEFTKLFMRIDDAGEGGGENESIAGEITYSTGGE